jgi:hypothetical protein
MDSEFFAEKKIVDMSVTCVWNTCMNNVLALLGASIQKSKTEHSD